MFVKALSHHRVNDFENSVIVRMTGGAGDGTEAVIMIIVAGVCFALNNLGTRFMWRETQIN